MTKQPEYLLEENLVQQLSDLGYKKVVIKDERDLIQNLQEQLQKHNNCTYSFNEFKQILNDLSKGNIYEKAKQLRDKIDYIKDDGTTGYVELINQIDEFNNLMQQMINFIFVELWKNYADA